jgi:acyl-CoA synthetase (AMP-forming)/AMP-acid ligase II
VVDRFAALLHARDVKNGDMVGVFTTNSPEMVVTLYALSKLGAVAAMINTNLRGTCLKHQLPETD